MTTLVGEGRGERPVSGLTAHLRTDSGRPTLDPETLVGVLQARRTGGPERDLILICDDPATALLTPLPPGASLVGVLARHPLNARAEVFPGIAVLSEVVDDLDALPEGAFAIVDPVRGRALVDPGPKEIALYQQSSSPRVLMGPQHDPARTQGGVTVSVWAVAETPGDADEAPDGGADGLLWSGFCDLDGLRALARQLGGGDLAVRAAFDALPPAEWLALGATCRLYLCLDPEETRIEQALDDLEDAETAREAEGGKPAGTARLCAVVETRPPVHLGLWDGVLSLSGWTPADLLAAPPVLLRAALADLPEALASGPLAIIVNSGEVARAKNAVRMLP